MLRARKFYDTKNSSSLYSGTSLRDTSQFISVLRVFILLFFFIPFSSLSLFFSFWLYALLNFLIIFIYIIACLGCVFYTSTHWSRFVHTLFHFVIVNFLFRSAFCLYFDYKWSKLYFFFFDFCFLFHFISLVVHVHHFIMKFFFFHFLLFS